MTRYTVTKIRKEWSVDKTHRHLEGVITEDGTHYTRREVVDSIAEGHTWVTSAGGSVVRISTVVCCHHAFCYALPYLRTNPRSTGLDNVENLPEA